MQQFELFDNLDRIEKATTHKDDNQSANQIWKFKRSVLFIIYSLVLLIVGFVLGAERTKYIARPTKKDSIIRQTAGSPGQKAPHSKQEAAGLSKVYIIQVASYKNLNTATSVKDTLKKQGFSSYIVNSKPYIKVFVGPYKSKKEAEEKLKALQKNYPDSFIK
ncbi:MAG: SPOR domain-containing protein [Candidatus Omnitrophota bacterium]